MAVVFETSRREYYEWVRSGLKTKKDIEYKYISDVSRLLSNAVLWSSGNNIPAECNAPDTVYMTLRLKENKALVHLINFTGGQRYFKRLIPVFDIEVKVAKRLFSENVNVSASMLSDGSKLDICHNNGYITVTVPKLTDYDVVVFESCI